jgi:hypothetical protein
MADIKLAEETYDARLAAVQVEAEQHQVAQFLIDSAAWESKSDAKTALAIKTAEAAVWAHTTRTTNAKSAKKDRAFARKNKIKLRIVER